LIKGNLEFSLIYSELFKYKIDPVSERFQKQINHDSRRKAITAMYVSQDEDSNKMGFAKALFGDTNVLSKTDFINNLCDP